jgi:hypothetical protein
MHNDAPHDAADRAAHAVAAPRQDHVLLPDATTARMGLAQPDSCYSNHTALTGGVRACCAHSSTCQLPQLRIHQRVSAPQTAGWGSGSRW